MIGVNNRIVFTDLICVNVNVNVNINDQRWTNIVIKDNHGGFPTIFFSLFGKIFRQAMWCWWGCGHVDKYEKRLILSQKLT